MNDFVYVPIIKWKQGEQGALSALDESIKDQIIPLIEIVPEVNIEKFESILGKCWANRDFYFDVIPECYEIHGDTFYFDLLEKCNPNFVIPVLCLEDSDEVIQDTFNYTNNGVAFRITSFDADNLEQRLESILRNFKNEEFDLIFDLKSVSEENIKDKTIVLKAMLSDVPDFNRFRNIILSGCSFPETLSNIPKYTITEAPRFELKLWRESQKHNKKYGINLIYSDYCINNLKYTEYVVGMTPTFNIRYTSDNNYILIKGDTIKKGGLDSRNIVQICDLIINSGYFQGENYSWGDNYIATRNCECESNGNLSTWRKVGTNHHITFVVNQLSNLP